VIFKGSRGLPAIPPCFALLDHHLDRHRRAIRKVLLVSFPVAFGCQEESTELLWMRMRRGWLIMLKGVLGQGHSGKTSPNSRFSR
jgi:hypothetical protein